MGEAVFPAEAEAGGSDETFSDSRWLSFASAVLVRMRERRFRRRVASMERHRRALLRMRAEWGDLPGLDYPLDSPVLRIGQRRRMHMAYGRRR